MKWEIIWGRLRCSWKWSQVWIDVDFIKKTSQRLPVLCWTMRESRCIFTFFLIWTFLNSSFYRLQNQLTGCSVVESTRDRHRWGQGCCPWFEWFGFKLNYFCLRNSMKEIFNEVKKTDCFTSCNSSPGERTSEPLRAQHICITSVSLGPLTFGWRNYVVT